MFGLRCRLSASRIRSFQPQSLHHVRFASSSKGSVRSVKARRVLITLSLTGAAGTAFLTLTDTGRFAYGAAERTGRVVSTLAECIDEYEASKNRETSTQLILSSAIVAP